MDDTLCGKIRGENSLGKLFRGAAENWRRSKRRLLLLTFHSNIFCMSEKEFFLFFMVVPHPTIDMCAWFNKLAREFSTLLLHFFFFCYFVKCLTCFKIK